LVILHNPHVVRVCSFSTSVAFVYTYKFQDKWRYRLFYTSSFHCFSSYCVSLVHIIVCKQLPWVSSHKIQNTWPSMLQVLVKYYVINTWAVSHVIICILCAAVPTCQQFEFRPLNLNILRLLLYSAYISEWQVSVLCIYIYIHIHGSVHCESNWIVVQQDATIFSLLYFCRQLYLFWVLTPIVRSLYNCNYSFWHLQTGSTSIRLRCWVGTPTYFVVPESCVLYGFILMFLNW